MQARKNRIINYFIILQLVKSNRSKARNIFLKYYDYIDESFEKCSLILSRDIKDLYENVNAQQEFKQFNLLSDEINIGYNNQERAQIKLLEEILNIHENKYKIISKIEIDNQGELNGK